MPTWIYN